MMPEWITRYWAEWAFGLVIAAMTLALRKLSRRMKKEQEAGRALRDGVRSLLRAQIIGDCKKALREGWCGPELRDMIADLFRRTGYAFQVEEQELEKVIVFASSGTGFAAYLLSFLLYLIARVIDYALKLGAHLPRLVKKSHILF